jgi:hypothetical protein
MTIAISAMALSGGISAYSQYQSSQFEAAQAGANANLEAIKAGYAEQRGASEAGRLRMEGSQTISAQKVALASSGVDPSSGSALNLFSTTRALSEQDAQTAKSNAAMEAWGHRVDEQNFRVQRRIAKRNSVLGPLSTVLGTAGQIAGLSAMSGKPPAKV